MRPQTHETEWVSFRRCGTRQTLLPPSCLQVREGEGLALSENDLFAMCVEMRNAEFRELEYAVFCIRKSGIRRPIPLCRFKFRMPNFECQIKQFGI
jgi:hypothetical protein